jgi:hypothetical protein
VTEKKFSFEGFRQCKFGITVLNPDTGLIRTGPAWFWPFLSEYGSHSDRSCLVFVILVRIQGIFEQDRLDFYLSCPNTGLFRTDLAWFLSFLSEYRAYSDRPCLVFVILVRIQGLFGQEWLGFNLSCPNTGLIRTGPA